MTNQRKYGPVVAYWARFHTLKIGDVALMMKGIDPRRFEYLPDWVDDDTSDAVRLLVGAARVGKVTAFFDASIGPQLDTEIRTDTLVPWLRTHGADWLAAGLQQHIDLRDGGAEGRDAVTATPASPYPPATAEIAECLHGLRWSAVEWKKMLGNLPVWLKECCEAPGQRGVSPRRWNPVKICARLVSRGHVQARQARARFQTYDALKPWLDQWDTYADEHFPDS